MASQPPSPQLPSCASQPPRDLRSLPGLQGKCLAELGGEWWGRLHPWLLFHKNQNTQRRAFQQGRKEGACEGGSRFTTQQQKHTSWTLGCSLMPEEFAQMSWEPQDDVRVQGSNFGLQLPSPQLRSQQGSTVGGTGPESHRP